MAKEFVTRHVCDFCGADGYDPAAFRSFTLSAAETKVPELPKPVGFDACTACMEAEPMSTLLKVSYPVAKPKAPKVKAAAEDAAPEPGGGHVCGSCGNSYSAPQGLSAHARWCGKAPEEVAALKAQVRAARAAAKAARS